MVVQLCNVKHCGKRATGWYAVAYRGWGGNATTATRALCRGHADGHTVLAAIDAATMPQSGQRIA